MKEIQLTQGKVAMVDNDDYETLNRHRWYAHKEYRTFYALRKETKNGKQTLISMHRLVVNANPGEMCDHINGDGLDNRRFNLRIVTNRQNQQNRHVPKTSRYPGVSWNNRDKRWHARIVINKKLIHLGYFMDEESAYKAYINAIKEFEVK